MLGAKPEGKAIWGEIGYPSRCLIPVEIFQMASVYVLMKSYPDKSYLTICFSEGHPNFNMFCGLKPISLHLCTYGFNFNMYSRLKKVLENASLTHAYIHTYQFHSSGYHHS